MPAAMTKPVSCCTPSSVARSSPNDLLDQYVSIDGLPTPNGDEHQSPSTCLPPESEYSRISNILGESFTSSLDMKFMEACTTMRTETDPDKRLRVLFDLFDVDQNQRLTPAGLQAFLAATMAHHNVTLSGVELQDIVHQAFRAVYPNEKDIHPRESLHFDEFKVLFGDALSTERPSRQARQLSIGASRCSVVHKKRSFRDTLRSGAVQYQAELYFLALYFSVNGLAFGLKWASFPYDIVAGHMAQLAKSCAQLVLVNAMFVLLPMSRSIVGYLRTFRLLWHILPFDRHISFHQLAGSVMLIAGTVHTVAWLIICVRAKSATNQDWQKSILNTHKIKLLRYADWLDIFAALPMWTGVAMLGCAAVAVPCTLACVRRHNFQLFWLTHILFLPFLVLLFVHGAAAWIAPPQAWFWVAGPLIVYVLERRFRLTSVFGEQTDLKKVQVTSNAMVLYLKKPRGYTFQPGMYLYLKVPELSTFEWHPFTISSAPEDEVLTLHIRVAGDWTSALHNRLKQHAIPLPSVAIDGPVGAPSMEYANYSTVVLIGGGIGVTPFASILKHLLHVWEQHRCPICGSVQLPRRVKLRKVYFYWITKEQHHMEWFRDMLNQLYDLDSDRRLVSQTYLTNVVDTAKSEPLKLIQTFMRARQDRDIFTGLQGSKMNMGRPNWAVELKNIAGAVCANTRGMDEAEEVGVFLCGPPGLDRDVNANVDKFNANCRRRSGGVRFSYHSEKF
ncbi:hypothetical protein H257_08280 [Aphanomyces astaci]|uniref:FAD-binding FR-type domain-containing protein n=1 Tax=Aphanomyces astaci TaxID=112090 RepID=W4GGA7_APHAT|nr:hypothetical protein H257_08280 [Aphanomyces astaci]ETV78069.1 hypothetical protein H257_08280 [Aphanomyces astaci]|eukprot:XP_009832406.1 hypothetical protein H257_08280 [Aphanomyces astaci]